MSKQTLINLEQAVTQTIESLGIKDLKVKVVDELTEDGMHLNGSYENGLITLSYTALQYSSQYQQHNNLHISTLITLAHEIGHHLNEHGPHANITAVDVVKKEMQAWYSGRQVIQAYGRKGLLKLYDESNKRNIHTYCHTTGLTQSDADILYNDCIKLFDREMGVTQ